LTPLAELYWKVWFCFSFHTSSSLRCITGPIAKKIFAINNSSPNMLSFISDFFGGGGGGGGESL
jgi:hypothetical protein